ncbi:MAG: NRDE family protein [Verrucomicrobia bacterium]|nr:NRDE family protein [Verrucomicrobiota bacterium]
MCTVSWYSQLNEYTLFFNRDESRNRQPGLPPKIGTSEETQYICPLDPEGGGTWLLVNEHGLTLGLLNYYEKQIHYQPGIRQTRGELPLKFASSKDLPEVEAVFDKLDLAPYPPLHFLAVDCSGTALLLTWDGQTIIVSYPNWVDLPITTSSFETSRVVKGRKALFVEEVALANDQVQAMERFHTGTRPEPDAYSVLMARPDAKTVSVSRIDVTDTEVRMRYQARPDDKAFLDTPQILTIPRS